MIFGHTWLASCCSVDEHLTNVAIWQLECSKLKDDYCKMGSSLSAMFADNRVYFSQQLLQTVQAWPTLIRES